MTTDTLEPGGSYWQLSERINYRQLICIAILAGTLAYALIIYPLAYYGQFVAADAQGAPLVQEQEGSLLNRAFFPLAAGLGLLMFLLERSRTMRINLAVAIPFVLFWACLGASALWALAPSVVITKFIVFTLSLMAVVSTVAVVDSTERYLKPMFWVAVATLLLNLVFVFLTAPSPIGHTGIYSHKNALGGAVAFCAIFLIYGITHPQRLYRIAGLVLIPVAAYLLYRSQGKTALGFAIVAPMIAGIAVFARYYFRLPILLLMLLATPVVLFILFSGTFQFSIADASMLITGDPTFTGRTTLWQFALDHIAERPLLGWGFNSFWQVGDSSPAWEGLRGFLQRTPHAHQGYLDLLLQGGLVLFTLFALVFLLTMNWITRAIDESPRIGWLIGSLVAYVALLNLLETTWLSNLDPASTMFLVFASAAMFTKPVSAPTYVMRSEAQG